MNVFSIESAIILVLFILTVAVEIFALVDALIRPARSYVAAEKLTKPAWTLILGLGLLAALLFQSPVGLLGLLSIVAAGVYLADVRPALAEVSGH